MKKNFLKWSAAAVIPILAACSSGSDSSSTSSEGTTAFPSNLAVASPFDTTSETASSLSALKSSSSGSFISSYAWATARIELLLSGASTSSCTFDPELFLTEEENAGCFGPVIAYQAHPDATSSADPKYNGSVLPGDAGIWTEEDSTTGHACAAAELNARMEGIRDQSLASLTGLASLICVINANGYSMPSNSTLDLTAEMTALGITDTTFNGASISHSDSTGSDQYSYALDFVYAPSSGSYDIVVDMIHEPGSTVGAYQGRLSFMVNDSATGGNCPTSDITRNGSLLYEATSKTDLSVEVRSAEFCGHDSDGFTDGLVDPSKKYDASSNPTGWGDGFNLFTADYDPSTLNGNYAFSWQAGPLDDNSRVFNVVVTTGATSGVSEGQAFYGYGDEIESADGGIQGFICNWSGPNADHTLQALAQAQSVSYDSTSGTFTSTDADITYAPTNSCEHVADGSFIVDRDLDNDLTDEDPTQDLLEDLFDAEDTDGDGTVNTIAETIEAEGFTPPVAPANL